MTATARPEVPYFPPEGGRFRMVLGLKVLADADWIEIDAAFADDLAEKQRLIAADRAAVFQALPDSVPAQREFFDHLTDHLGRYHSQSFRRQGDGVRVVPTGRLVVPDPAAPLLAAAALVQEDVLLLQPGPDGAFRLVAGLLAFPTRWSLAEKMGRPLAAIHAPVPGYGAHLERPMDRLFAGLRPGRLLWRSNWSLLDDPALHQPGGHGSGTAGRALDAATVGERLWFRVERQTLSLLPDTGTAVFTVRIHQARLQDRVRTAAEARDMRDAILEMPEEMRRYKSMPGFLAALLQWLEEHAEQVK
ncbi:MULTISPECIES: DUF3445 domain-containing protein [unclassified Minwuia]|uniref:heme-dependent oxidative N-demethylase family protein n=1 Tax=unclassified Minwuia TaxID=2618799 RepID=UPI00247995C0|nr:MULTISPECIES: DUF3445 domain-containing protein [unclassified Minwuia]